MKSKILSLLLMLLAYTPIKAETIQSDVFAFDVSQEDATYQPLPNKDQSQNYLCLWNGDNLAAYFSTTAAVEVKSTEDYLDAIKSAMKGNGAKKMKVKKLENIQTEEGQSLEVWTMSFEHTEQAKKLIFYSVKIEDKFAIASVTLSKHGVFEAVKERSDLLMKMVKIIE